MKVKNKPKENIQLTLSEQGNGLALIKHYVLGKTNKRKTLCHVRILRRHIFD